jgi:hypothetical protein
MNLSEKIFFKGSGKGRSDAATGSSDFSFIGNVEHPLISKGDLNRNELAFNIEASAKQLPIVLLCNIACLDPHIQEQVDALIGEKLDIQLKTHLHHMNGPLNINLRGNNGHLALNGEINNTILTLYKDLIAEVTISQKLSKSILQDLLPFMSSAIGAEKPVKIVIPAKGFSLPLIQLNLKDLAIPQAMIDLGKVSFSNEGQLGQILSLLQSTLPSSSEPLNVWFTPLYLSMVDGSARLARMDMLVTGHYPMAIWGKVNFVNEKVGLNIGLSAKTLSYAFDIKGLNENYMMVLPLTGTLTNTSIDKGKALAKISALVAQSQGGTKGLLLGGVLGIIGGGLDEDKIPAPTTSPLPWDEQPTDSEEPPPQKNDKHKQSRKILKHLEKEASSLLEFLR